MRIDIYSDTICPWCLIGKRRLERALAERPQPDLEIAWRAFQLNPNMPAGGMDRRRYLELKFGGAERAQQTYEPVLTAGAGEGIDFAFDRILRTPNTALSHRFLRMAQAEGRGQPAVEAVFSAYFFEGRDIGRPETLLEIAGTLGLDAEAIGERLENGEGLLEVLSEDARAREIGIQGVPTFIFDGKYMLSGAHPPEVLFQMFDLAKGGVTAPAG
jgi:predicted DsbA family dithiol-disulfide isomerase